MTNDQIQSILGAKTVSFNAVFAKATGSVTAAVFLSQAIFWQEKAKFKTDLLDVDGEKYFSKTASEWYEETGLSTDQQKTARVPLIKAGILKEKRAGLPAKMYFRVDIESLVSGIAAYLNTGNRVSGFAVNKGAENPRTVNGKYRKQEDGKPESNIIESFESSEREGEREEKNSPSADKRSPVEAEKNVEGNYCAGAGPTLVELHDAAHPDIPVFDIVPPAPVTTPPASLIELGERPNVDTPVQLEAAMRKFYTDYPNEWSVGILDYGRGGRYDAPKQAEIVKDFCCWAISQNRQRDTYRELNARLQGWFRNEQHSTWKQVKPGQPGNTDKPVYERPKNAIY